MSGCIAYFIILVSFLWLLWLLVVDIVSVSRFEWILNSTWSLLYTHIIHRSFVLLCVLSSHEFNFLVSISKKRYTCSSFSQVFIVFWVYNIHWVYMDDGYEKSGHKYWHNHSTENRISRKSSVFYHNFLLSFILCTFNVIWMVKWYNIQYTYLCAILCELITKR